MLDKSDEVHESQSVYCMMIKRLSRTSESLREETLINLEKRAAGQLPRRSFVPVVRAGYPFLNHSY
jgi:hypothetical protein